MCAGYDPLHARAGTGHELGRHLDLKVGDASKNAISESPQFFFAMIDGAEGHVLVDAVVGEKGEQLFSIVRRPRYRPII
jgi:hypothetical protein